MESLHSRLADSLGKVNEEIRLLEEEKLMLFYEMQEEKPFESAEAAANMLNINLNLGGNNNA